MLAWLAGNDLPDATLPIRVVAYRQWVLKAVVDARLPPTVEKGAHGAELELADHHRGGGGHRGIHKCSERRAGDERGSE